MRQPYMASGSSSTAPGCWPSAYDAPSGGMLLICISAAPSCAQSSPAAIFQDTIFHWAMRGPGGHIVAKILRKPPQATDQFLLATHLPSFTFLLQVHGAFVECNEFPISYAIVYMALHATSATLTKSCKLPLTLFAQQPRWVNQVLVSIPVSLLCESPSLLCCNANQILH